MRRVLFALLTLCGLLWSESSQAQKNAVTVWKDGQQSVVFDPDSVLFWRVPAEVPTEVPAEAIDLGLPSGLKWASYNVGATSPEESGGYYAWGETEEKDYYDWSTYIHCDGSNQNCHDIGSCISGTQYDVAHVKWGGKWRMPTYDELSELFDNCSYEWTQLNGVNGAKFTGSNGNSIFLPAAGRHRKDRLDDHGSYGTYWSGTLFPDDDSDYAYSLRFYNSDHASWYDYNRYYGFTVRPVFGDTSSNKDFTVTVNGVSFKMVRVSGGTFQMGATAEQGSDAYDWEKPVHSVTLSDFAIGETEVTQALWQAVMGQTPTSGGYQWSSSYGLGANNPAYYVSWSDCQAFITQLNELTGLSFRLPTEAEWEFAARGGNSSQGYKYAGSNTIDDVAWYEGNSYLLGSSHPDYGTHAVGTKSPNELGLYDMSGNVWEWCQDWYNSSYYSSSLQDNPTGPASGSLRVLRGGSWRSTAGYCRVSNRDSSSPSYLGNSLGLRLAL